MALFSAASIAPARPRRDPGISKTITKHWLRQNIFVISHFPRRVSGRQTLSAFLRSILGNIEFSSSSGRLPTVATDIRTGEEVVIKEGRVADAVRARLASDYLPAFLYKGHYLVDGGLVNPVPTSVVASMGADVLISIKLTAKLRSVGARAKTVFFRSPPFAAWPRSSLRCSTPCNMRSPARTEIAHVVIAPDMRDYLWTEFHRSEDILKVGEAAARKPW